MRLVYDHVSQIREEVPPAIVVRKDSDVEHVRVRQDQIGPLADLPAALALGVAVVNRGTDALDLQLVERADLVLCQSLRRVEVERAQLRLFGERGEHRQVERERLAARGSCRDNKVLTARGGLPGRGLVGVERVDSARLEALTQGLR